jgi:NADH-quinone oxidoreductase subunit L
MTIESLLHYLLLLPLLGAMLIAITPPLRENVISGIAMVTLGIHSAATVLLVGWWIIIGAPTLNINEVVIYSQPGYQFLICLYFDKITAVYLLVGTILTALVTVYSRIYLHREQGYRRFFTTILLFFTGYCTAVCSGNLETLIVAWEVLGISSFLLIAFYRDRYLPVKNAIKVFSIYRIGDIGLILAMWLTHHLFHGNVNFYQLPEVAARTPELAGSIGLVIGLMFVVASAGKSAQLPFSSWLPRAMEGPTPSSAIFYGSLSVHMGVFLLLRTFPYWEHQIGVRVAIGLCGFTTAFIVTGIGRVQSAIKAQIAYASIAQIGLIFIEIAFGWTDIALYHFVGNAFLRTYQLLVSPSVVSYLIREQFYDFDNTNKNIERHYPKRLAYTLYILCLKEWNLDQFLYRILWNPLKQIGNLLTWLTPQSVFQVVLPATAVGLSLLAFREVLPSWLVVALPTAFAFISFTLVIKAFTKRIHARIAFLLILLTHLWIALAISFSELFTFQEAAFYLGGVGVSGIVGLWVLTRLKQLTPVLSLSQFHGYASRYPVLAFVFLLACLGVSGFPITTTFIGEDLVFSHIHEHQILLAFLVAMSYLVDGLALIRLYSRVFLGPYSPTQRESNYRSA